MLMCRLRAAFLAAFDYLCDMDFDKFAQGHKECYSSENGFLMWRLKGGSSFEPCTFDNDNGNIIAHVLVCDGELRTGHGGSSHSLTTGCFGGFIDNPQLQLLSASPDIDAYIIVCKDAYTDSLLKNSPPIPFSYVLKRRNNPVEQNAAEMTTCLRLRMECIREACLDTANLFYDKMIKCAVWMLLLTIADRHIRSGGSEDPTDGSDRAMQLFTRFMRLLPTCIVTEHFAGYYADRLSVTPQYLNRIVKSISGRTVSGWINFHLVGEITRRLDSTNASMQQIAADLNFPDQATLTKFYKRETGYSLTEYKKRPLTHK